MDSIIFDVDGTLWDSTEICAKAWTDVIHRETSLSLTINASTLKGLFGRLLPDIASVLFADYPKEEQLRLIDRCCQEEHKALLAQCAPLYPDLEKTLQQLKENYRLFIVSNCQAGYIEVFLETSGLGSYFEGHLCPGDTGNAKADNICKIIQEYHLKAPCKLKTLPRNFFAKADILMPGWLMHLLNIIINILRSVPFLILMICVFPLTRIIVGTTVGTKATIVPLVVAAFPFVARLVETSLRELDEGVVEAAQSMGATPFQIITKVMIPECLPGLISSMTTALTTILGYSAMSGVIGGGGLGKIALSYGYYRYQTNIMIVCVILLVLLVQIFQTVGTFWATRSDKRLRK